MDIQNFLKQIVDIQQLHKEAGNVFKFNYDSEKTQLNIEIYSNKANENKKLIFEDTNWLSWSLDGEIGQHFLKSLKELATINIKSHQNFEQNETVTIN